MEEKIEALESKINELDEENFNLKEENRKLQYGVNQLKSENLEKERRITQLLDTVENLSRSMLTKK